MWFGSFHCIMSTRNNLMPFISTRKYAHFNHFCGAYGFSVLMFLDIFLQLYFQFILICAGISISFRILVKGTLAHFVH